MKYEELQAHIERDLVKRAMQLSRYEIPEIASFDPGSFAVRGAICICEEPVQELPYAKTEEELAQICGAYIRKKAVSRNIYKKRQEDLIRQYETVRDLKQALGELQGTVRELNRILAGQDLLSNSLTVSEYERRSIFLKNKVAQRKYLQKELGRKEEIRSERQKNADHLDRHIEQKETQIRDIESHMTSEYTGRFVRLLYRKEAGAEKAANDSLKRQADVFRDELDSLKEERKEAEEALRSVLEEIAVLSSQDDRLAADIARDEQLLERSRRNMDNLKKREEQIASLRKEIAALHAGSVLSSYSEEEVMRMGTVTMPECLKDALGKLTDDAEAYLKAVLGISDLQRHLVYLRDVLNKEAIPDPSEVMTAMQWLVLCIPAVCMTEELLQKIGLPDFPVLYAGNEE